MREKIKNDVCKHKKHNLDSLKRSNYKNTKTFDLELEEDYVKGKWIDNQEYMRIISFRNNI